MLKEITLITQVTMLILPKKYTQEMYSVLSAAKEAEIRSFSKVKSKVRLY